MPSGTFGTHRALRTNPSVRGSPEGRLPTTQLSGDRAPPRKATAQNGGTGYKGGGWAALCFYSE